MCSQNRRLDLQGLQKIRPAEIVIFPDRGGAALPRLSLTWPFSSTLDLTFLASRSEWLVTMTPAGAWISTATPSKMVSIPPFSPPACPFPLAVVAGATNGDSRADLRLEKAVILIRARLSARAPGRGDLPLTFLAAGCAHTPLPVPL